MNDPRHQLLEQTVGQMLAFSDKLARGARHLAEAHVERGGCTDFEEVLDFEGTRLRRYRPHSPREALAPILIVYALVNRPYMLDLEPERSFLRGLLEGGRSVYLADWGYPDASTRDRSLDDYVVRHIDACIEHVLAEHRVEALDLLGVCQGGTFSLCQAALDPARIRRLALLVTPVDFAAPDFLLTHWLRHVDVEAMVARLGNVPGELLNGAFVALKPLTLSSLKALELIELLDNPRELATFARMEQWIHDSPDQAGRAFLEFANAFVRDNALVNDTLTLAGKPVRLADVTAPVLNVYARSDHIVPPASSRHLATALPRTRYTELAFDGGHIGLFASRAANERVPNAIIDWLDEDHPAAQR